jgi:hypothetical protein
VRGNEVKAALLALALVAACHGKPAVAPAPGNMTTDAATGWYCASDPHDGCARTEEACGSDCTQADSAVCTSDGHCFADDDTCQQYLVEMGPHLGCTETP